MVSKSKNYFSPMLICWNDIKIHLGFEDSYFVPPPNLRQNLRMYACAKTRPSLFLSQGCEWTLSLEPFLKTKFALIDQLSARVIRLIQNLPFQKKNAAKTNCLKYLCAGCY